MIYSMGKLEFHCLTSILLVCKFATDNNFLGTVYVNCLYYIKLNNNFPLLESCISSLAVVLVLITFSFSLF